MIAILGRFARNFILIWLCIAQPTVAIASEISWAGNIVSEDFQHHVDWRGHPEDLSSDIRVQSTYQISPDNEVAVQTSIQWKERISLQDLSVGFRSQFGQFRYGKLSSLLSEPVAYQVPSKKTLARIPIFLSV